MQIQIDGIDAVNNMLQQKIDAKIAKVGNAIAEGCELVVGDAKGLAPYKTGNLHDSIHSQSDGLTGVAGTNVEYSIYQEYGTYKMKAHPFLFPALQANKAKIYELIKEACR